jgi:hypothetical protein
MDRLLSSDVLNNIKVDTLKIGTAQATQRFAETQTLASLADPAWLKGAVLVLLGFAVYQLAIRRIISTEFASGSVKLALDDILKVGTMLVFKQLAENRTLDSLRDDAWQKSSAYTLIGFVTYDFVTRHVYDTSALSGPTKVSVDDAIKFGTMFVVSQFLAGKPFDANFFMVSGGFIAGLIAYNFFLSHI